MSRLSAEREADYRRASDGDAVTQQLWVEIDELRADIAEANSKLKQYKALVTAGIEAARVRLADNEELRANLTNERASHENTIADLQKLRVDRNEILRKYRHLQTLHDALRTELTEAKARRDDLAALNNAGAEESCRMDIELADLRARNVQLLEELARMKAKADMADDH